MKILMEFPKPKDPNAADAMPEAERKQVRCCDGAHACACVHSFMPTYLLLLCLCTSSELANNRYPLHPHIPPPQAFLSEPYQSTPAPHLTGAVC